MIGPADASPGSTAGGGPPAEPRRPSLLRMIAWAVFFGALAVWSAQNAFSCAPESALVGQPAPELDAAIVAGEGRGDRISLAALRGRPVLLDFWASWCPPCRASVPILTRLARAHAEAGLVTLGVNVETDRPPAFVERAHRALGAGFPSLHDQAWALQTGYEVRSLPTLVLIDRRGVVRRWEVGVPDEEALDAQIREILAETP